MCAFLVRDGLGKPSCGAGSRRRGRVDAAEEKGGRKETWYLNDINKFSHSVAGDVNNSFAAGMMKEDVDETRLAVLSGAKADRNGGCCRAQRSSPPTIANGTAADGRIKSR